MKGICIKIFFAIALTLLLKTGISQELPAVLDLRVDISAENNSVEEIIKKVADKYQMYFAYNPLILPEKSFSFSYSQIVVKKLLAHILPQERYKIESFDGQIIITLIEKTPSRFEGLLIDKKTREPIPYGSISIMGESIGTISNSDGIFELVIPERLRNKMITVGCLGYRRTHLNPDSIANNSVIELEPFSFKLKEIKVRPIKPEEVLENMRKRLKENYSGTPTLMTSFYRETLQQDDGYIGVWEAVMEILKSPYRRLANDKVRYLKGRKNYFNIEPEDIKLKIQGGPWYITKLDVIKTNESFIDPEYEGFYRYKFEQPVIYNGRISWVISFSRKTETDFPCFEGHFLVDVETAALVMAKYGLDKKSLKLTGKSFIRKEPKGVNASPTRVEYLVTYRIVNGKWHMHTARTDVRYKVKQKSEKFRGEFRSISDLLITKQHPFPSRAKFRGEGIFHSNDIFSELKYEYDPDFWGNYNIIKPGEELKNALKKSIME